MLHEVDKFIIYHKFCASCLHHRKKALYFRLVNFIELLLCKFMVICYRVNTFHVQKHNFIDQNNKKQQIFFLEIFIEMHSRVFGAIIKFVLG